MNHQPDEPATPASEDQEPAPTLESAEAEPAWPQFPPNSHHKDAIEPADLEEGLDESEKAQE